MKHIRMGRIIFLTAITACLLYFSTISASGKYDYSNIVFSTYGAYEIENGGGADGGGYLLTDVRELYQPGFNRAARYYSARVEYNKSDYSEEGILEAVKEGEGFLAVSLDEAMRADEVPEARLDPFMQREWHLDAVNAYGAWDALSGMPGEGIVVAVIDSGVDYIHSDLKDNMWVNEAEAYGTEGYDDDGNGIADDIYGACFYEDNPFGGSVNGDPYDTDPDGHGTHVAGIIAMEAGNGGGRGIAYASKIMAVKAGGADGSFLVSDVISAVGYAVKMGADVINMSFGATCESEVLEGLLRDASESCVLVAAAGNEKMPAKSGKMYPAAYPFVIGVMASDESGAVARWSNYDTRESNVITYDLAAPGVDIYSSVYNDGYRYMSGTSMAAPVVSAAAAAVYADALSAGAENPAKYTFGQIVNATDDTAAYKDGYDNEYVYPRLDMYDALTTEPSLNMNVCGFNYMTSEGGGTFPYVAFLKNETAYIYCGFDIQNRWSVAKDVMVDISVDSVACAVVNEAAALGDIDACGTAALPCGSENALSFAINGTPGEIYDIPITYRVTGYMPDDNSTMIEQKFEDTIRVSIGADASGAALAPSEKAAGTQAPYFSSPAKEELKKPGKVKNLRMSAKAGKGGKKK